MYQKDNVTFILLATLLKKPYSHLAFSPNINEQWTFCAFISMSLFLTQNKKEVKVNATESRPATDEPALKQLTVLV